MSRMHSSTRPTAEIQLQEQKDKLAKLKKLSDNDKRMIVVLQDRIAGLVKELDTRTQTIEELQSNGERLALQLKSRLSDSKILREDHDGIKTQLQETEKKLHQSEMNQLRMESRLNEYIKQTQEHDDTAIAVRSLEAELSRTKESLSECESKNKLLETEEKKSCERVLLLTLKNSEITGQLEEMQVTLQKNEIHYKRDMKTLYDKIENMQKESNVENIGEINTLLQVNQRLKKDVDMEKKNRLDDERLYLKEKADLKLKLNQIRENMLKEKENQKKDTQELYKQLHDVTVKLEKKEHEHSDLKMNFVELKSDFSNMTQQLTENRDINNELVLEMDRMRTEMIKIKVENNELKIIKSQLEETQLELNSTKNRLETLKDTIHKDNIAHSKEKQKLIDKLERSNTRIISLSSDTEAVEMYKRQLLDNQKKTKDLKDELAKNKKDVEAFQHMQKEVHTAVAKLMRSQQSMETSMSCLSCIDMLNQPTTCIPCGHTFCKGCLDKNKNNVCPECDEKVEKTVNNNILSILSGKFVFNGQTLSWLSNQLDSKMVDNGKDNALDRIDSLSELLAEHRRT